ncbi:MAG: hypothetical protein P0Y60_14555 [Candidatus Microbacterium colombiense]|nr:MAG: hypothetical protein P0Y60_14555 [Microbacterium sp.]
MSEYTPSTGEVRRRYAYARSAGHKNQSAVAEFDRWLAAHDAEVLREAATEMDATTGSFNPANPNELAYINCTRIDAQELRHRADRIERNAQSRVPVKQERTER